MIPRILIDQQHWRFNISFDIVSHLDVFERLISGDKIWIKQEVPPGHKKREWRDHKSKHCLLIFFITRALHILNLLSKGKLRIKNANILTDVRHLKNNTVKHVIEGHQFLTIHLLTLRGSWLIGKDHKITLKTPAITWVSNLTVGRISHHLHIEGN